jgi:hypothetical protein
LEGLVTALAVHLLRSYGSSKRSPIPHRGRLAPRQMRRILDYIDANLTEDLGLIELAAIAGLSAHHFGEAFKISGGNRLRCQQRAGARHGLDLPLDIGGGHRGGALAAAIGGVGSRALADLLASASR